MSQVGDQQAGPEFDLTELLASTDPEALFAELVEAGPVLRGRYVDGTPVWLITGYDECRTVLKDRRFSTDVTNRTTSLNVAAAAGLPEDVLPYLRTLVAYDPPEHSRLRKLASRGFTARQVTELRPRISSIVTELLDEIAGRQDADLMSGLAVPLPIRVICLLLGVPDADLDHWRGWAVGMAGPDLDVIAESTRGIVAYMRDLIATKRRNRGEDVLSSLIDAHEDGDRLTEEELVSLAITILLAGHETTVELLGNGSLMLLTHPRERALLRENPERIPAAVEEMVRLVGPATIAPIRYTREPVRLADITIPADEPVQVVTAAANRDPKRFAHPAEPQLGREDNPHLGFGQGIHFCLGATLARAEADIAFRALLDRFPDMELSVPPERLTRSADLQRTLTSLPVRPHGA